MSADFWMHCPKCGVEGEPDGLKAEEDIYFEAGTTATSPLELVVNITLTCQSSCGFSTKVSHRHFVGRREGFEFAEEARDMCDEDCKYCIGDLCARCPGIVHGRECEHDCIDRHGWDVG